MASRTNDMVHVLLLENSYDSRLTHNMRDNTNYGHNLPDQNILDQHGKSVES